MDFILKLTLRATSIGLAVVSCILTARFMYGIGQNIGLAAYFLVAGICLDLIKTLSPLAAVIAWRKGEQNIAVSGTVLAVVLTSLSLYASYSNIESSVNSSALESQASSEQRQQVKSQITSYEKQIESVLDQQAVYTKNGMATKAAELNPRVDHLTEKLNLARAELKTATEAVQPALDHGSILAISATIELACIVSLVLAGVVTKTSSKAHTARSEPVYVNQFASGEPVLKSQSQMEASIQTTTTRSTESVQVSGQFESLGVARQLIISGTVYPSERRLSDSMGISRKYAGFLLNALENEGTLVRNGQRRELIDT